MTRCPPTLRAALLAAALLTAGATESRAQNFAPLDRLGPRLTVSPAQLDRALKCTEGVRGAARDPILFLPGTGLSPEAGFGWNWIRVADQRGWPYCALTYPRGGWGDVQETNEFATSAVRRMFARAGRKIDTVGYSQGGTHPRWSTRFWPDTRAMIDDYISLDTPHFGSASPAGAAFCATGSCAPAAWQYQYRSAMTRALNSGSETFPGIDYTSVYSRTSAFNAPVADENGVTAIHVRAPNVANVATQDVCPADTADHFRIGSIDPAAFAIAADALEHDGPAVAGRVSRVACSQLTMPGVEAGNAVPGLTSLFSEVALTLTSEPMVPAEPKLKCYVTASCADRTPPRIGVRVAGRRLPKAPRVRVWLDEPATVSVRLLTLTGPRRVVARGRATLADERSNVLLVPKRTRRGRRIMRRARRLVVRVEVTARDANGNWTTRRVRARLRR